METLAFFLALFVLFFFFLAVSKAGLSLLLALPVATLRNGSRLPGGRLVFLTNSPLSAMCVPAAGGPAGSQLLRGPADLRTVRWPGGGVEHHPSHGDWIRVLVGHGFAVEGLHELHAPADHDPDHSAAGFYQIADLAWARQWPAEDLWSARLVVTPSG